MIIVCLSFTLVNKNGFHEKKKSLQLSTQTRALMILLETATVYSVWQKCPRQTCHFLAQNVKKCVLNS